MKRFFHRPGRKKRDDGAANEYRQTGTPQVSTTLSSPECPTPRKDEPSVPTPPLVPAPTAAATGLSSTPSSSHTARAPLPLQNDAHGPPNTISSGMNVVKKDYWQLAIDKLKEEDPSTADQIAAVQQAAAETGSTDFAAQLLRATKQSQATLEAKRWKIPTRGGEVVLRDHLDRLLKVVTVFKDVGNAAASLDPVHAGLPLAGFCVLMQVRPICVFPVRTAC